MLKILCKLIDLLVNIFMSGWHFAFDTFKWATLSVFIVIIIAWLL